MNIKHLENRRMHDLEREIKRMPEGKILENIEDLVSRAAGSYEEWLAGGSMAMYEETKAVFEKDAHEEKFLNRLVDTYKEHDVENPTKTAILDYIQYKGSKMALFERKILKIAPEEIGWYAQERISKTRQVVDGQESVAVAAEKMISHTSFDDTKDFIDLVIKGNKLEKIDVLLSNEKLTSEDKTEIANILMRESFLDYVTESNDERESPTYHYFSGEDKLKIIEKYIDVSLPDKIETKAELSQACLYLEKENSKEHRTENLIGKTEFLDVAEKIVTSPNFDEPIGETAKAQIEKIYDSLFYEFKIEKLSILEKTEFLIAYKDCLIEKEDGNVELDYNKVIAVCEKNPSYISAFHSAEKRAWNGHSLEAAVLKAAYVDHKFELKVNENDRLTVEGLFLSSFSLEDIIKESPEIKEKITTEFLTKITPETIFLLEHSNRRAFGDGYYSRSVERIVNDKTTYEKILVHNLLDKDSPYVDDIRHNVLGANKFADIDKFVINTSDRLSFDNKELQLICIGLGVALDPKCCDDTTRQIATSFEITDKTTDGELLNAGIFDIKGSENRKVYLDTLPKSIYLDAYNALEKNCDRFVTEVIKTGNVELYDYIKENARCELVKEIMIERRDEVLEKAAETDKTSEVVDNREDKQPEKQTDTATESNADDDAE